jgi:hypothetical protein
MGICAAAALAGDGSSYVRCQDRDELDRLFTEYNALKNGIPAPRLSAHTEPLLGGLVAARWDLILSNIPAKAGKPVLEDFVLRSAGLLNPSGRVLIVVVNPLANWFRSWITKADAPPFYEERGKEIRFSCTVLWKPKQPPSKQDSSGIMLFITVAAVPLKWKQLPIP